MGRLTDTYLTDVRRRCAAQAPPSCMASACNVFCGMRCRRRNRAAAIPRCSRRAMDLLALKGDVRPPALPRKTGGMRRHRADAPCRRAGSGCSRRTFYTCGNVPGKGRVRTLLDTAGRFFDRGDGKDGGRRGCTDATSGAGAAAGAWMTAVAVRVGFGQAGFMRRRGVVPVRFFVRHGGGSGQRA